MSGNFGPQMAQYHLLLSFKKELYTLASLHPARSALIPFCLFLPPCPSLLYSFKRENIPFLGSPEMSDKLRYESRLYLHQLHTSFAFFTPYFLSWVVVQERKLYTHQHHYTPFLGTQEMSDKLRYEWQIILRYYPHIIHEVSLERPTTTSPFTTIHLERKTAPHILSHRTTHLQYWWKDYAYSLTQ